jgi:hypothetical protein
VVYFSLVSDIVYIVLFNIYNIKYFPQLKIKIVNKDKGVYLSLVPDIL